MSDIAKAMGISRNSVIGKVHRLGLVARIAKPTPEEIEARKKERDAKRNEQQRLRRAKQDQHRSRGKRMHFTSVLDSPSVQPAEYVSLRISFIDLRDFRNNEPNQCRFIADEPPGPDYLACGNETPAGESYCVHCKHITHRTSLELTDEERSRRAAHMRRVGKPATISALDITDEAA